MENIPAGMEEFAAKEARMDGVDDLAARVQEKKAKIERGEVVEVDNRPNKDIITPEEYEDNKEGVEMIVLQVAQRASRELVRKQQERAAKEKTEGITIQPSALEMKYQGVINAAMDEGFTSEQINRISEKEYGYGPSGMLEEEVKRVSHEAKLTIKKLLMEVGNGDPAAVGVKAIAREASVIGEIAQRLNWSVEFLVSKTTESSMEYVTTMVALGFWKSE